MNSLQLYVLARRFKKYERSIKKSAAELMKATGKNGSLEIYLVGSDLMDKNVLAFPGSPDFPRPDLSRPFLGEIYLNPDYIARHKENLFFMLTHGFLHLLGYDHHTKGDTIKMERQERALMTRLRQ